MSKKLSTTLTLAVTALKNLEERKGASPYDICNYISSVYNIPKDVAKRKALVALKRGTSYGLLKETSGRYNLLTDTEKECLELTNQELGLLNLNCRKRRLERKRRLRGTSKQTVKGKISRRKKSLTSRNNSRKSSRGKRNKKRNKKKKKRKGKSISKSRNKKRIKRSKSRRRNSTIKRGQSCVCPPGGNRRARKTKSRSISRSRKKRSKSNSRRSRSRKPRGKRITKSVNKLTSKSRSRSRKTSKSKSRKRSRSKSTSKRRIKKIKVSKKTGKKKRSTSSCECPTNPARKIVTKSTGNDNKKIDKPPKIKKESKQKKQKRVKKDKENKEPKKDNCLVNFLGVSSGNLMDTRLKY